MGTHSGNPVGQGARLIELLPGGFLIKQQGVGQICGRPWETKAKWNKV